MDQPNLYKQHHTGNILAQAEEELQYEAFRKAVEEKKIELLKKKPLLAKLFPFKISIQKV